MNIFNLLSPFSSTGMAEQGVSPLALIPGVGMLLVGIGFLVYSFIKNHAWQYLAIGAAAWLISVAVKFSWAIQLNQPIANAITTTFPGPVGDTIINIYIGLLTGVFEVGLVYLFLRFTKFGRASWNQAFAFGVGFGAIEALLLGVGPLVGVIYAMNGSTQISPDIFNSLEQMSNPAYGFAPVWERFFTIWVHIFCNTLLFYAISVKQMSWFWISFIYKTVLDAVAGFAQTSGLLTSGNIVLNTWIIELIVGVMGAAGWFGVWQLAKRYPQEMPIGKKQKPEPVDS